MCVPVCDSSTTECSVQSQARKPAQVSLLHFQERGRVGSGSLGLVGADSGHLNWRSGFIFWPIIKNWVLLLSFTCFIASTVN